MNPNQPSREQIEARITALLLGDLPADEAELLRWTISQDPELQKLHGRLLLTVGLVREVVAHPEEASAEKAVPRKLSDERRQKLLAHFKTPRPAPKELFWLKRIEIPSMSNLAAAALVIFLIIGLAALSIPNFIKARSTSQANSVINNMRQLDGAKNEWALENKKSPTDVPTPDDLKPYIKEFPKPVMGETYVLGKVSEPVTADVDAKQAKKQFGSLADRLPPGGTKGQLAQLSMGGELTLVDKGAANASVAPLRENKQLISAWSANSVQLAAAVPSPAPLAPTLAPPPSKTEIVLPKPDTTPEVQAQLIGQNVLVAAVAPPPLSSPIVAPPAAEMPEFAFEGGKTVISQSAAIASAAPEITESPVPTDARLPLAETKTEARDQGVAVVQLQNGDPQHVAQVLQNMFEHGTKVAGVAESSQNSALQQRAQSTTTSVGTATAGIGGGAIAFGGGGGNFGGAGGFGGGGGRGGGGGNPFAAQFGSGGNIQNAGTAGGAAISVDPNTHNLVIVADAETQDQIKGVISQLDKPSARRLVENAPAGRIDSFDLAEPSALPATPSSDTTFAWNDNTLDRSGTENQARDGWHGGTLLGPVPSDGTPPAATVSEERVPGVSAAYRSDLSAPQNLGDARRTTAGEVALDKKPVPVLGDLPLEGRLFESRAAVARAPVVSPPPPASAPAQPQPEISYTLTGMGNEAEDLARKPKAAGDTLALNAANTYVANNGTLTTSGGTLLNRNSSIAGEPVGKLGEAKKENGDQSAWALDSRVKGFYDDNFTTGVTRDDANGNRNLFYYNTASIVEPPAASSSASPTLTQQQLSQDKIQQLEKNMATGKSRNSTAASSTPEMRVFRVTTNMIYEGLQNVSTTTFGSASSSSSGTGVGGLAYINPNSSPSQNVSAAAQDFFSKIGVNLAAPDRSIAYSDKSGLLFVKATPSELDTVERVVQTLNQAASDQQLSSGLHGTKVAGTTVANQSEMVTQIVPVRFADTRQLVAKLAPSVSPQATIVANEAGNSIVITDTQQNVKRLTQLVDSLDVPPRPVATNAPIPQPEFLTRENAFSTFSMNVSDVSFKLAQASLQKGQMPDAASIRSEEFINAFDYRDPEAAAGQPLAFASERTRDPFAHNRDFLRFSVKTAAAGRQAGHALNLVLLLDTSGSMERADRVAIIREALRVLAAQLQPQDTVSVVTFARTARLWADGVSGDKAGATLDQVGGITPDGGTNLEEAMRLAYETAHRHYLAQGANRVVLLTDGAANLGNVDPNVLKQKVEAQRRQGIALDCFGIGWEDFNDDLLEQLSGNGDGRYAFINSPDEAGAEFAAKLAGALQVAAQDVKVQVEFNPQRVVSWRQIGYAKHQLTKEQFRDNTVLAAEIAAQEAGNALYTVETKPDGAGPIATVYVRYRIPGTQEVRERSWTVDGDGAVPALDQSSAAMRLAATAGAFSEWLAASPFAQEVTPDELLKDLSGVPQIYGADQRPQQLEWMIRQAKSLSGK